MVSEFRNFTTAERSTHKTLYVSSSQTIFTITSTIRLFEKKPLLNYFFLSGTTPLR